MNSLKRWGPGVWRSPVLVSSGPLISPHELTLSVRRVQSETHNTCGEKRCFNGPNRTFSSESQYKDLELHCHIRILLSCWIILEIAEDTPAFWEKAQQAPRNFSHRHRLTKRLCRRTRRKHEKSSNGMKSDDVKKIRPTLQHHSHLGGKISLNIQLILEPISTIRATFIYPPVTPCDDDWARPWFQVSSFSLSSWSRVKSDPEGAKERFVELQFVTFKAFLPILHQNQDGLRLLEHVWDGRALLSAVKHVHDAFTFDSLTLHRSRTQCAVRLRKLLQIFYVYLLFHVCGQISTRRVCKSLASFKRMCFSSKETH